jgi:hypothetical protein
VHTEAPQHSSSSDCFDLAYDDEEDDCQVGDE